MAKPIRYAEGFYCILRPQGRNGKQIKRVFSWRKHPNPQQACQDFIDRTIGGKHSPEALSLEQTIRDYLRHCHLIGRKRPSTIRTEESRLKKILQWANANKVESVLQFDVDAIRKFQLYFFSGGTWWSTAVVRKVGDRKSTWLHYLMALSALFKWCESRGIIQGNPARLPEFKFTIQRQIPARIY